MGGECSCVTGLEISYLNLDFSVTLKQCIPETANVDLGLFHSNDTVV